MRVFLLVLAGLVLASGCFAFDEHVDVRISANGTAEERYTLTIPSLVRDTQVVFPLDRPFDAIHYEGNYTLSAEALTLSCPVKPGINTVEFTFIRNNASVGTTTNRRYGGTFSTHRDTQLSVSISLPEGMVLRNIEPAVSPRPKTIRSDGRSVVIDWVQTGSLDAIILYEQPGLDGPNATTMSNSAVPAPESNASRLLATGGIVLLFVIGGTLVFAGLLRRRARRTRKAVLMDVIGPDEQKVVEFLRHGFTNQKHIAEQAGFTKSKMSKVVRKLEEKRVLTKTPHFKTNKLSLQSDWK